MSDDVMSVPELAKYLNISEHAARRLLTSGKIKAAKAGREWRVLKTEVDIYLRGGSDE